MKTVRILMGNDTWDPILLPDRHYGDEYDVPKDVLDRFESALVEFETAHDLLVREAKRVVTKRHG